MQTHRRKKVEIVVERARAAAVLEHIEELGATGYTLINDVSGKGHRGARGASDVLDVYRSVLIIVITTEDIARRLLAESASFLEHTTGIVYVGDVEVLRGDHF